MKLAFEIVGFILACALVAWAFFGMASATIALVFWRRTAKKTEADFASFDTPQGVRLRNQHSKLYGTYEARKTNDDEFGME